MDRVFCVYVGCEIRQSQIFHVLSTLKKKNAAWYTIILSATASDSALAQYLAPYTRMALAEFYRDNSMNALLVIDDLTNQAYAYRQMSLLIGRAPRREAYPEDIFYVHSRLLKRAAQLSKKFGYGSITAIPIVETQEENIASYIPTNVINITNGQIYLSSSLFRMGILPAININKSISKIDAKTQSPLTK